MGVKPVVIVPDHAGIYVDLEKMGVPVYAVTFRTYTYSHTETLVQKLLFIPRMVAKIIANKRAEKVVTRILKERRVDIVHTNVGLVNIGFRASRNLGLPHVYHLREYGEKDFGVRYFPRWNNFYRQLEANGSYTICITRDIQAYHHQKGKPTSAVIYNAICAQKDNKPLDAGPKEFFLFAGRLQSAKGVDFMLEAYSLYASKTAQPLQLRIAGELSDSVYVEKLKSFVALHKLQSCVKFLGECHNVEELMRGARATIIPSLHEAFGRVMPEAMLQGCLCIAHDTAGTKEQLDNGLRLTGDEIALRYDTTEELAQLLAEVASRPANYYDGYRERAFRVVNQLYTQESNARQVYDFYREILG